MSIERIMLSCATVAGYTSIVPISVSRMDEKGEKANIKYVEDCMLC